MGLRPQLRAVPEVGPYSGFSSSKFKLKVPSILGYRLIWPFSSGKIPSSGLYLALKANVT
jgi:hypothetical protein